MREVAKTAFLVGHDGEMESAYVYEALGIRLSASETAYRFFFAQAPTRSSAFSMFSIELATLKRK